MGIAQETLSRGPVYRQTKDRDLPHLPNKPRNPHIPHSKAILAGVILALVGTAVSGTFRKSGDPISDPDTAVITMENQAQFVFDGSHRANISLSPDGKLRARETSVAQVLRAESFKGESLSFTENTALPEDEQIMTVTLPSEALTDAFFVPVVGNTYGQDIKDDYADVDVNRKVTLASEPKVKDPFGSVYINGMEAGIFLLLVNSDMTPIEGPNGKPLYAKPSQVNLQIPEQAPEPVIG